MNVVREIIRLCSHERGKITAAVPEIDKQAGIFNLVNQLPGFEDTSSGHFKYIKRLGYGSRGQVIEVQDLETQRNYALKIQTQFRVSREDFINEVEIHNSLKDCDNILPIRAAFEGSYNFYILMDKAEGTLRNQNGMPEDARFQCVMKEVLTAVQHCHRNNILHRDIKPDNFLLMDGKVKLTDFGTSVRMDGGLANGLVGTGMFIAPEVRNEACFYGFPADMFSVGVTMYAMLRGHAAPELQKNAGVLRYPAFKPCDSLMEGLTGPCLELLRNLLLEKADARRTTEEAMSHDWFGEKFA